MIAVAIVFLVLAALLVLWFLLATGDSADVDLSAAGLDVHVSPIVVFLLGAVALALALAALRFFYWGTKRGARKRRERKDLEKQAQLREKERDDALAEREREHARLVDREQAAAGPVRDRDLTSDGLDTDRPLGADGRRTDDLGTDRRGFDDLPPDVRR